MSRPFHSLAGPGAIALSLAIALPPCHGQEASDTPTLPLPVITTENIQIPDWPPERPMANSMRAWHYNPALVMPMVRIGEAVQSPILDYDLQMMLAAVVSSRNGCRYCLCTPVGVLNADGQADSLVLELQGDIVGSSLTPKVKAVLLLAEQLTVRPTQTGEYVREAIDADWTYEEIAQVIFFVSYMNMMNRIAQAFRLPPDHWHPYDTDSTLPMLRCGN